MAKIKVDRNRFYNLISLINDYVQKLGAEMFASDINCPPTFMASLKDDGDVDEIVITVNHNGSSFTETIFPIRSEDTAYGYKSLQTTLECLYNRTM